MVTSHSDKVAVQLHIDKADVERPVSVSLFNLLHVLSKYNQLLRYLILSAEMPVCINISFLMTYFLRYVNMTDVL